MVYEHSKRLLGNLIVLLACREDYAAACEARLTQYDMHLNSSSLRSLSGQEDTELERYGSVSSTCNGSRGVGHTSLISWFKYMYTVALFYYTVLTGC